MTSIPATVDTTTEKDTCYPMSDTPTNANDDASPEVSTTESQPLDVAICIDNDASERLRPVLRHLCVGLIDHSIKLRVISEESTGIAETLGSLGPVQVHAHPPLQWPLRRSRTRRIQEFLISTPPDIIYAIGGGVFELASDLAEQLEVDLAAQFTSYKDIESLHLLHNERLGCVIAASDRLAEAVGQSDAFPNSDMFRSTDSIALVRPGVLRGERLTCFQEDNLPAIVCNARLETNRGVAMLIEATAILRDRSHAFLLFLLNEGPEEAHLRKIVRERDLASYVSFSHATAKIADILRGSDVFVIAPGEEDISARPLQAMASGTPIVAFDGGAADFLHNDETAVVCSDRTPTALAKAIESLLLDHAFAQRIATNAIDYVKKRHQMTTMADLTYDALKRVVIRRRTFRMPH